jgi:hypothetical protein
VGICADFGNFVLAGLGQIDGFDPRHFQAIFSNCFRAAFF